MSAYSDAEAVRRDLGLLPHPEGGFYRQTYRSSAVLGEAGLPSGYGGPRATLTSIYFLLTRQSFSAFHRLRSDEIWHFYDGAPIHLFLIGPAGVRTEILLGRDPARGLQLQAVVPAGTWFGAYVEAEAEPDFALVGCDVAPGFDFLDFELADRAQLIAEVPQHRAIIERLTR
ncbi:MAG: cupin domain-containing protein [Myxococcota bacterium]